MGEAKRRRERLGEWYGKPVVLGHPNYVPPVKQSLDTCKTVIDNHGDVQRISPLRPKHAMCGMSLFALAAALGLSIPAIGIEPPPSMRRR